MPPCASCANKAHSASGLTSIARRCGMALGSDCLTCRQASQLRTSNLVRSGTLTVSTAVNSPASSSSWRSRSASVRGTSSIEILNPLYRRPTGGLLVHVHALIGRCRERFERFAVTWVDGHADAGIQVDGDVAQLHRPANDTAEARGDPLRGGLVTRVRQDRELVPTQPGDDLTGPEAVLY